MAETKYGKYIVTQPKAGRTSEHAPGVRTEVAYLDNRVSPWGTLHRVFLVLETYERFARCPHSRL